MPASVLDELVAAARRRSRSDARLTPSREVQRDVARLPRARRFEAAIRGGDRVALVAEAKRSSPSEGPLGVDAGSAAIAELARGYATAGATALSILTEPTRFGGQRRRPRGRRSHRPPGASQGLRGGPVRDLADPGARCRCGPAHRSRAARRAPRRADRGGRPRPASTPWWRCTMTPSWIGRSRPMPPSSASTHGTSRRWRSTSRRRCRCCVAPRMPERR